MILAPEIGARRLGRRVMQIADRVGDLAVDLFGEGVAPVPGPQPGFDVADADAAIEGGERRGHGRRRVALSEDPVGSLAHEDIIEAGQDSGGRRGQRLVGAHEVEIIIGSQIEEREHLIEHLAVLRRDTDDAARPPRMPPQLGDDRGHFDRFGAGAENRQYFHRWNRGVSFGNDCAGRAPKL
jgi:hypothetical protein